MDKKELDYLLVLKALSEIPFGVGKKLLMDFLIGKFDNESIRRNRLDKLPSFGSLAYDEEELSSIIDNLVLNNLISVVPLQSNKFIKLLQLSKKGYDELKEPQLFKKKLSFSFKEKKTEITEKDKLVFDAFGPFLSKFNDEQKKAIISNSEKILCIAGAGCGKTTVLTKKIEYLVKYRAVDPSKILAITFTRKARQEMMHRLSDPDFKSVQIETFNSFCEKILTKFGDRIYGRSVRVLSSQDKFRLMNLALGSLNINMRQAVDIYFTAMQKRGKTDEELAFVFMNDCFFIRDYFKTKNKPLEDFAVSGENEKSARMIFQICRYIDSHMSRNGLRDYTDQIIDTINFFRSMSDLIPKFDYILVDEYQDINDSNSEIIDLLAPKNLFCVGDPRQAIYGWRGSKIGFILNFGDKYPDFETITLTKNYRSSRHIVSMINTSISNMRLPDLESTRETEQNIFLLEFDNEDAEFEFVIQKILSENIDRNEIFVLARTNRQLTDLSNKLKVRGIRHVVRSDELRRSVIATKDDITLATIHAIKGLEAKVVFVIGCTVNNFPCRSSDHPVIDMVKIDDYDKEEEERRLLYVAMSRAKDELYLTNSSTLSKFITEKMKIQLHKKQLKEPEKKFKINPLKAQKSPDATASSRDILDRLRQWRKNISQKTNLPAYMILHDRTLIELSEKKPLDDEDLKEVYGMGPSKIQKYGVELLQLVNQ